MKTYRMWLVVVAVLWTNSSFGQTNRIGAVTISVDMKQNAEDYEEVVEAVTERLKDDSRAMREMLDKSAGGLVFSNLASFVLTNRPAFQSDIVVKAAVGAAKAGHFGLAEEMFSTVTNDTNAMIRGRAYRGLGMIKEINDLRKESLQMFGAGAKAGDFFSAVSLVANKVKVPLDAKDELANIELLVDCIITSKDEKNPLKEGMTIALARLQNMQVIVPPSLETKFKTIRTQRSVLIRESPIKELWEALKLPAASAKP